MDKGRQNRRRRSAVRKLNSLDARIDRTPMQTDEETTSDMQINRIFTPFDAWPAAQLLARTFYAAGPTQTTSTSTDTKEHENDASKEQKKLAAKLRALVQRLASPSRLLTTAPVGSAEFHARMEQVYATELFLTLCASYLADPLRRRVFVATQEDGDVVGVLCVQRIKLRRNLKPLTSAPERATEAAALTDAYASSRSPRRASERVVADEGERAILFTNFCVSSSLRRRGVGSLLLAEAARDSSDAAAHVLQVLTDNAGAYQWYCRRGFLPIANWRDEQWCREVNLGRIPRRARKILLAREATTMTLQSK